ncbi:hypothetical protein niasHT_003267 [Heterodera trifolii]|uniref:Uncharacterized protein n=1 Tax=Heterodera trifolii TaxID=157864 RepID=A0ABD2LQS9_9BILA
MSNRDNSNGQQPYHLSSASANDNSQHFTTAFKMGIVARRLLKNRAIQKQLDRRQKNMKTLRRQQAAAAARSSIVVHSAGIGLPRTDPVHQRQEICTVPSHEVIYDVPFDAQREEEEDEDSF